MDQHWQQIEDLFNAALEQPWETRIDFLKRNCSDERLRREVESLLEKEARSHGPIDQPAWHDAAGLPESKFAMLLPGGSTLGPYTIKGLLGSGGMGQVYSAYDSRLGRAVAIKTSRDRFSDRFEREARAIAALNHPNVCTLYDIGPNYLVMELVEGPTLADRIRKGSIPLDEALEIAGQIAEALEAAHDMGIVHRDLKPQNIKCRPDGTVKVLDFGLAKMASAFANADGSPSVQVAATDAGMILGTAAYMAPEQARGEPVDKRADIWSFGAILYEMLTGKRLFTGKSLTDVLAGVLKEEPDLSAVPPRVRLLIRSCLEKDPRKRLRDIGDALRLIADDERGNSAPVRRFRWVWPGVTAVAALTVAAALMISFHERPSATASSLTFQIIPPGISRYYGLALSPDGEKLAFSADGFDGVSRLWVREFNTLATRSIPETEGFVGKPIWSPDARYLAFASGGKLKKVDVSGGSPVTLCDWFGDGGLLTGSWGSNGVILFSRAAGGLRKVSSIGGTCSDVTTSGIHPSLLPDGRHFLYLNKMAEGEHPSVYIGSLDLPVDQKSQPMLQVVNAADFVQSQDRSRGYIAFQSVGPTAGGTLMIRPFDFQRTIFAGEPAAFPVAVAGGFGSGSNAMLFSFSSDGTIAYSTNGTGLYQNVWYDRSGRVIGTAGDPGDIGDVAISPDGMRAVVHNREAMDDLWVFDFSRRTSTRLTIGPDRDHEAVWSPDGQYIIWGMQHGENQSLYIKPSNGAGDEHLLTSGEPGSRNIPDDWSPDGRFLLYAAGGLSVGSGTGFGQGRKVWALPLKPDGTPAGPAVAYLDNPLGVGHARFSPNGRWVAYTIGTATENVYVSPFPGTKGREERWVISNGGGYQPLWTQDSKELLYLSPDGKVMSVEVTASTSVFQFGTPKTLFAARIEGGASAAPTHRWDVSPDGQRFLITTVLDVKQSPPINVVTNWESALK